ncbi:hypothetical protein NQ314_013501, partial [Rhamnusium bicolor]
NGKTCTTPNGESAICISIYDCQKLLDVVQTSNTEQLRFLRQSQCGYDRNPLVCCGSDNNFDSTQNSPRRLPVESRNNQIPKNDAIPNRDTCGYQFTERIYNGNDTNLDEFPWMALLEYSNSSGYRRFSCGGTIINPRYILTAAHCVTGDVLKSVGRLVNIRVGEWNIDQEIDCIPDTGTCNSPPQNLGIEESIVHPQYNNRRQDRYYDIALVRLNKKITYSTFVRPICLPLPGESSRVGEKLIVAGWGRTESAKRSAIKQKVEVPLADRSKCTSNFRSAGINLKDSQICAGGEAGKDSCTGDSGGPLMRTTINDVGQWYIEGIVSFGARCGTEGWPGIYTKVLSYLNWIYKTVKE